MIMMMFCIANINYFNYYSLKLKLNRQKLTDIKQLLSYLTIFNKLFTIYQFNIITRLYDKYEQNQIILTNVLPLM